MYQQYAYVCQYTLNVSLHIRCLGWCLAMWSDLHCVRIVCVRVSLPGVWDSHEFLEQNSSLTSIGALLSTYANTCGSKVHALSILRPYLLR